MAEPQLIYKIIVLELLEKSELPLNNSQLTNFFLDGGYTDYFSAQQAISSDLEAGLIVVSESTHNSTSYTISEEGKKTLSLFRDKLNKEILSEVISYLGANGISISEDNSVKADYYEASGGGYLVECKILDEGKTTLELKMNVSSKAQAESICTNWKAKYEDVYMNLMDILVQ